MRRKLGSRPSASPARSAALGYGIHLHEATSGPAPQSCALPPRLGTGTSTHERATQSSFQLLTSRFRPIIHTLERVGIREKRHEELRLDFSSMERWQGDSIFSSASSLSSIPSHSPTNNGIRSKPRTAAPLRLEQRTSETGGSRTPSAGCGHVDGRDCRSGLNPSEP
jgi:hypothetical protein